MKRLMIKKLIVIRQSESRSTEPNMKLGNKKLVCQ